MRQDRVMGGEGGRGPGPDESGRPDDQPWYDEGGLPLPPPTRFVGGPGTEKVTHPDSPSGQPYSAPRRAWGGNADPRNLSYEPEGLRYFGPGYEHLDYVPWDGRPPQSYLPPPSTEERIEQERYLREPDPQHPGYARNGLRLAPADTGWLETEERQPRSWFARHKVLTGLLAVVALFLLVGIIGTGL